MFCFAKIAKKKIIIKNNKYPTFFKCKNIFARITASLGTFFQHIENY